VQTRAHAENRREEATVILEGLKLPRATAMSPEIEEEYVERIDYLLSAASYLILDLSRTITIEHKSLSPGHAEPKTAREMIVAVRNALFKNGECNESDIEANKESFRASVKRPDLVKALKTSAVLCTMYAIQTWEAVCANRELAAISLLSEANYWLGVMDGLLCGIDEPGIAAQAVRHKAKLAQQREGKKLLQRACEFKHLSTHNIALKLSNFNEDGTKKADGSGEFDIKVSTIEQKLKGQLPGRQRTGSKNTR
jgi:hypothetical protein